MDRESETLLVLAARTIRFASDHPYFATGAFGAAVGSVVTYKVLTFSPERPRMRKVFTPKVYELALAEKDLRRMLADPAYEIRWETADTAVIISAERPEPMKQLPDIDGTVVDVD